MLSWFNSMTSFRKTREVLLDWYLNDLLLQEKFVLPAMTPVSLKTTEFLRGKLEGMSGVQVISYLLPDFSPFHCPCFKTIWFCYENFPYLGEILIFIPLHRWTESEQNKIIKVNKRTMASCSRSQFSPTFSSLLQAWIARIFVFQQFLFFSSLNFFKFYPKARTLSP